MAARDLNWDDATTMYCIGYLANPAVETSIEVEIPRSRREEFEEKYETLTGQELQLEGDRQPYYVWPTGTNKFGMQCRVYYRNIGSCPDEIADITRAGRSDLGPVRINRTNLVFTLFEYGFTLGRTDIHNVLARVASNHGYQDWFWEGFTCGGVENLDVILELRHSVGPPPWFREVRFTRTRPSRAYTYLLQYGSQSIWKIGYTRDVVKRLRDINAHVPYEYTGEYWNLKKFTEWEDAESAYEMEQKILMDLSQYRGLGERLNCSFDSIQRAWEDAYATINT